MPSARGHPEERKLLPSLHPELDLPGQWKVMYDELMATGRYNPTQALEEISHAYGGISRSTLRYHLFPSTKVKQIKSASHQWAYQKNNPRMRQRVIAQKARYMAARRHIDELVRAAYQQVAPRQGLTLEELAYLIHESSGVLFRPRTLLGLAEHYQERKVKLLLERVPDYDPTRYRLYQHQ